MFSHISANTVEHMVASIVEQQTGKKVSSVAAKYIDEKFVGYDITFVTEKTNSKQNRKPRVIDKTFKQWVID
jgi:hypothetical protein